jgi:hypothetical protein
MTATDTILIDTANYLQTLARNTQGVVYAPPVNEYPTTLDTPNCPMVVSWPADGSWYVKGGAARQQVRTWRVACYVEPIAQNDIPSNTEAALLVMQRLINTFTNVANIPQANPPPYQLTIESSIDMQHSDAGLDVRPFRGVVFAGFELRVHVRALW